MHIFKVGKFPQILTKYSSIENHFVPYIDHPLDHFYDPTIDHFDGLPCVTGPKKTKYNR